MTLKFFFQKKSICRLLKSLYALKQTPTQWTTRFDESTHSFLSVYDACVYMKSIYNKILNFIILIVYVCAWVRLGRPKKSTAKSLLKPWRQTQPSSFTTTSELTDDFNNVSTSASKECIRVWLLTRASPFKYPFDPHYLIQGSFQRNLWYYYLWWKTTEWLDSCNKQIGKV